MSDEQITEQYVEGVCEGLRIAMELIGKLRIFPDDLWSEAMSQLPTPDDIRDIYIPEATA